MASRGWERVSEADLAGKRVNAQPAKPRVRVTTKPSFDTFIMRVEADGMPAPESEKTFIPHRRFRADYIWFEYHLIVEREGGIWGLRKGTAEDNERAKAAHSKPKAILRDIEKSNLAQVYGFRYLRFPPEQIASSEALAMIRHFLKEGGWK